MPDVFEKIVVAPTGTGAQVLQRALRHFDMNCNSGAQVDGPRFLSATGLAVPTLGDESVAHRVTIEALGSGTTVGINIVQGRAVDTIVAVGVVEPEGQADSLVELGTLAVDRATTAQPWHYGIDASSADLPMSRPGVRCPGAGRQDALTAGSLRGVDLLEASVHDVVPMSRSTGVDVVTGEGLAEALAGVECVINFPSGASADQQAVNEHRQLGGDLIYRDVVHGSRHPVRQVIQGIIAGQV